MKLDFHSYYFSRLFSLTLGLTLGLVLTACGGAGNSITINSSTATPVSAPTMATVATGVAVAGATISAVCDAGSIQSVVTDANGIAAVDFSNASLPCLLRASFTQNAIQQYMYSLVTRTATFNVTPLTSALIAEAWRTTDMHKAFTEANSNQIKAAGSNLGNAIVRVRSILLAEGLSMPADPIYDALTPKVGQQQGDEHDKLLDALRAKFPQPSWLIDIIKKIRGNSPDGQPGQSGDGAPRNYSIGGTVSGLSVGKTITLQNNAGDDLTISVNGAYQFSTPVTQGGAYAVNIKTQPLGQTCSVSQGVGTATDTIMTVAVVCASLTYTISGSASGIEPNKTVVIQNNAAEELIVSSNGGFNFATPIASGSNYAVTVKTQAVGQICTVGNASGTVNSNISNVSLNCSVNSYTVGGMLSGLAANTSVVLQNNAGNDLTLNADGNFTFSTPVASGANYAITIKTQPNGQTCVISSASGVANSNSNSTTLTCSQNPIGGGGGGAVATAYPMTAAVNWSLCDGGVAYAQGADSVSNSNCIAGAIVYTGLAEAQTYINSMGITQGFNGGWNYNSTGTPVAEGYLLRTAQCHSALTTLRSVGGGARGDQTYVRAPIGNQTSVVEITGGRNRDFTALFPYSLGLGLWSCN